MALGREGLGAVHTETRLASIRVEVYPGADSAPNLGRVLLGTIYGFVDGAICGWVLGLLYEAFSHGKTATPNHT